MLLTSSARKKSKSSSREKATPHIRTPWKKNFPSTEELRWLSGARKNTEGSFCSRSLISPLSQQVVEWNRLQFSANFAWKSGGFSRPNSCIGRNLSFVFGCDRSNFLRSCINKPIYRLQALRSTILGCLKFLHFLVLYPEKGTFKKCYQGWRCKSYQPWWRL